MLVQSSLLLYGKIPWDKYMAVSETVPMVHQWLKVTKRVMFSLFSSDTLAVLHTIILQGRQHYVDLV